MTNSRPRLLSDVSQLPEELRGLVERQLIEGATFEDIVEAVNERGGCRLSLGAVQDFFRSNPGLQQKRIRRQLEVARALKKAVGNPRSGREQLVQALILTGMMRLSRRDGHFEVKDAVKGHQQEENQMLRERNLRLAQRNLAMKLKLADARLERERAEVKHAVEEAKDPDELRKKIDEIYGIPPSAAAVSGEVGGG